MILGRVVGNIISTIKEKDYEGKKLLLVEPYDILTHSFTRESILAIDTVDAGPGDIVLVLNEGGSVRMVLNNPNTSAEMVIVAVVDHMDLYDESKALKNTFHSI